MIFVIVSSVKLILTFCRCTTSKHNYMEDLSQDLFCSPLSRLAIKMLPTFGLKCSSREATCQNQQAHAAIIAQSASTNHQPIFVPITKQLRKISSQVAVLRTMPLHFWTLTEYMVWVTPGQLAHEAYVKKHELTSDADPWRMDPI